MSDLMLDVGQAVELKLAFRREGTWTNEAIKRLCDTQGLLARVLDVLEGRAEIVPFTGYTQFISGKEVLTLDPTDGSEIIADAKKVFKAGIDADFVNWGCNVLGAPTPKQKVAVHEIVQDGTFAQVFTGLDANLDNLCLTQAQIIQFASKHKKWLRTEGYATFFLFKIGSEFFVARVDVDSDGELHVDLYRFSYDFVWRAEYRHRVVVPQSLMT